MNGCPLHLYGHKIEDDLRSRVRNLVNGNIISHYLPRLRGNRLLSADLPLFSRPD